jgi:excinuclease ABC subunit A
MKECIISYKGIRTNNLKNISIDIPKGCFWGISGPSGSGKSSLAYGTIFAISQYEWEKVSNIPAGAYVNFKVDEYNNVIPSIALKQENLNNNPRSTIATFLRVDKDFKLLFASANNVSPSIFSFNNPKNACPYCNGLGYVSMMDETQLIDWNLSVVEKPFKPWRKDYHQTLLEKFALSRNISVNKPLKELNNKEMDQLLHGMSEEKLSVSYKVNGKRHTHLFTYVGLLDDLHSLQNDKQHISSSKKLSEYSNIITCGHCRGMRFSDASLKYRYKGKNIGELYSMGLIELDAFISSCIQKEIVGGQKTLLRNIHRIVNGLIDGNLEYLNLNRSIPSLSGGELQRIRLVNILTSQIDGMMYIIDEPSARLHVSEYDSLLAGLKKLKDTGNTLLMIEHNPYFLKRTDRNIYVGPGSGDRGGELVTINRLEHAAFSYNFEPRGIGEYYKFENISENNIHELNVSIPMNRITGIYGPSGSGKSTLARNIERMYKGAEYINQKPLRGSKVSTVASYSEVMDSIRDVYAQANHVLPDIFNFNNEKGQCHTCGGNGSVSFELDFGKTKIDVVCDDCQGKRFNKEALSYKYKGFSIYEVLNLTIDKLLDEKIFTDDKIVRKLTVLKRLGLGYLTLFRTTDTLSGGEAQRLKLMKCIGKRLNGKLFIFDEPLRGLSNLDAKNVLLIFNEITCQGGTVVFIEHNVIGFEVCDFVLEMGPGKGEKGGKVVYAGTIADFKKSNRWQVYNKYLQNG